MKVVAKFGPESAGLIDNPDPVAKGEFVVVKIHSAPMCTEYKSFKNEGKSDNFGHEAAGEVVEIAQEGTVKVGDRVVVMPHYPCGSVISVWQANMPTVKTTIGSQTSPNSRV